MEEGFRRLEEIFPDGKLGLATEILDFIEKSPLTELDGGVTISSIESSFIAYPKEKITEVLSALKKEDYLFVHPDSTIEEESVYFGAAYSLYKSGEPSRKC